eukprot:6097577-Prymnesium_polylepis.1
MRGNHEGAPVAGDVPLVERAGPSRPASEQVRRAHRGEAPLAHRRRWRCGGGGARVGGGRRAVGRRESSREAPLRSTGGAAARGGV